MSETETTTQNGAEAAPVKPAIQLYIVKSTGSSGNFISSSETLDEYTVKKVYTFPAHVRKKISAIRMQARGPIDDSTLNFYGLRICSDNAKERIQKSIDAANIALSEIAPGLHAEVMFLPLDFDKILKGSVYRQVVETINYQAYSGLFDRMQKMLARKEGDAQALPEKSRKALIRMCDSLKAINVTENEDVTQKLDEFKSKLEAGEVKEVFESLKEELDGQKSRWQSIEL